MTIYSDKTIRDRISRNELVFDGDIASARHCSYEFKAGRVVYGGIASPANAVDAIDLCGPPSKTAVIVPSGVAWVRTRERVEIPANAVGMWVQTNSLSRRGLLLLNSTLVEPGYVGHLSALFVNFGSSPVTLSSDTTIAKLVIFELDDDAVERIDSSQYQNYDAMIDALAAQSSGSFLRISELMPDLSKASEKAISGAKEEIARASKDELEKTKDELSDLRKETFLKVGGGFVLGLILAVLFVAWLFPKVRDFDLESKERITTIVRERNDELSRQLNRLESDLRDLRSATTKPPNNPSQPTIKQVP